MCATTLVICDAAVKIKSVHVIVDVIAFAECFRLAVGRHIENIAI